LSGKTILTTITRQRNMIRTLSYLNHGCYPLWGVMNLLCMDTITMSMIIIITNTITIITETSTITTEASNIISEVAALYIIIHM
jgi:hypothetical protein